MRITLGSEFDAGLRADVFAVLGELGAVVESENCGIGGSQEVEEWRVRLGSSRLIVEAETYVGLSISGEEQILREFCRRLDARRMESEE